MKQYSLFLAILVLSTASCITQRFGDLTVMSTKNVNIGEEYVRVAQNVEGKDAITSMVFIYSTALVPNLEEAVDRALESADGDLLTNVVIYFERKWFVLWGEDAFIVKGDVWKKADFTTASIDQLTEDVDGAERILLALNDNGEIVIHEVIGVFEDVEVEEDSPAQSEEGKRKKMRRRIIGFAF